MIAYFALGALCMLAVIIIGLLCYASWLLSAEPYDPMGFDSLEGAIDRTPDAVNHAASFVAEEYPVIRAELAAGSQRREWM